MDKSKPNPFYGTPLAPLETMDDAVVGLCEWHKNENEFKWLRPGQYLYNHYGWEYKNSYQVASEPEVYTLFQEWLDAGSPEHEAK